MVLKNCLICGNEIYIVSNRKKGEKVTGKRKRGKHAVTCSHKCSVIYGRIYHYIDTVKCKK